MDEVGSDTPHVQAHNILVIHPGSLYLRVGRASDLNPHTELHAIAFRRRNSDSGYADTLLPSCLSPNKDLEGEVDNCRLQVSHMLQSCLMSDGRRRYATPPQQISAFNRRSQPQVMNGTGPDTVKLEPHINTVIGDQVLEVDGVEWNVHTPMRRGELNVHTGVGGSLSSVLSQLEAIWTWVIENKLHIQSTQFKNYRAVLIIPDIYNRLYLRELSNLLCQMGFSAFFLVQDHVAATFGAGLGSACVVDCGHAKTSVSCVEDGISQPQTRVRLPYGGGDITQCLHWLLHKCGFPYKGCKPETNHRDAMLLESLKHSACHVDLDRCGCTEKVFTVVRPDLPSALQYTIQVADECMIAPLGLFVPELLGLTGPKPPVTQSKAIISDPSDPHDADYLRETGRKSTTREREDGGVVASSEAPPPQDDDYVDIDSTQPALVQEPLEFSTIAQLLGVDQAVLQSVQRCGSDEVKKKMYSSVLIVGGGMKFQGIGTWLRNKISLQVPFTYRTEQMDIVMGCKEMDPTMTVWKGAAIMSCLESSHELWISSEDWSRQEVKILRERAPFLW